MREHGVRPQGRRETDSGGRRYESEQLENHSFLWDEPASDEGVFHDGWSAIRPRPRPIERTNNRVS